MSARVLFFVKMLLCVGGCCYFFSACERDIDLDLPEQDRLVVFSNFTPDSLFKIHLSTTIPFVENNDTSIVYPENATIQLFEDGNYIEDFIYQRNANSITPYYFVNANPKEGTNYSFVAEVPDYPKTKASNSIPKRAIIERLDLLSTKMIGGNEFFKEYELTGKLILGRNQTQSEYYHLRAWRDVSFFDVINSDTIIFWTFKEELQLDFADNVGHLEVFHEPGILMGDKAFTTDPRGAEFTVRFAHQPDVEMRSPIQLEIRSVSEDYYRFHRSVGEQEFSSTSSSLLSNRSVLIHNNIKGGIGNFAGYNVTIGSLFW